MEQPAQEITIDSEQNDLIFFIGGGSSSNVTIQNLTFTGGEISVPWMETMVMMGEQSKLKVS